ncbi:hypothetical protein Y032_0092g2577 [Ancylostoma ceylanicum]|uniref:Uncharacterized protein n=1 Tax=Ancylostoma ceylanicum TaxID=53326 RepID=A0A016TLV0_9BILA|nr:hypothetical protein Y032_0092g2577 [Ancylostoma ceylanicum]
MTLGVECDARGEAEEKKNGGLTLMRRWLRRAHLYRPSPRRFTRDHVTPYGDSPSSPSSPQVRLNHQLLLANTLNW